MRILACQSGTNPQSMWRIEHPAMELARRGHEVDILTLETGMDIHGEWFLNQDVVILQRYVNPELVRRIRTLPGAPKVVWETDDLIWQMRPDYPNAEKFTSDAREGIRQTIRACDAGIASTEAMRAKMIEVAPKLPVYVVRNGIDFGARDWEERQAREEILQGRIVIGWSGGDRSMIDFRSVGWAVADVLERYPQTMFAVRASFETGMAACKTLGIPSGRAVLLPPVAFNLYPPSLTQFDIGLAPMADTPFNRCKGDLKVLEYGAWGIPCVASDVEPYRRFQAECGSVLLASKPEQWKRDLEGLIVDSELRHSLGMGLRAHVRLRRTVRHQADQLIDALEEVVRQ